jgi:hypothetical protein
MAQGKFVRHQDTTAQAVDDEKARLAQMLAQFGAYADDLDAAVGPPPRPCYLWPENLPIWQVWLTVQTQWRAAGMTGVRTGLDYAAVLAVIDRLVPPRRKRAFAFAAVCEMESSVLTYWADQQATGPK